MDLADELQRLSQRHVELTLELEAAAKQALFFLDHFLLTHGSTCDGCSARANVIATQLRGFLYRYGKWDCAG